MHELQAESDTVYEHFFPYFLRNFSTFSMVAHGFFFFVVTRCFVNDPSVKMKGRKNRKLVGFNALIVS